VKTFLSKYLLLSTSIKFFQNWLRVVNIYLKMSSQYGEPAEYEQQLQAATQVALPEDDDDL